MSGIQGTAAWVRGTATDAEVTRDDALRTAPWTLAHYRRLQAAVKAAVETRTFVDGGVLVDSKAWWRLLGALGRDGMS